MPDSDPELFYICSECAGVMQPTGVCLPVVPPLYVHQCEKCGHTEHLESMLRAEDDPDDIQDRAYMNGRRALARQLMRQLEDILGGAGRAFRDLLIERDEVRSILRDLCERHGDSDWTDSDYLPDVLRKHLGDHLDG